MGMRATVAFVNTDKSVKLTSVQWSTRLDQTLGHMAHKVRENGDDHYKAIAGLFRTVTSRWNHVSSIELNDGAPTNRDIVMGANVVVNFPQKDEPQKRYANRKSVDIYNYHLDGGSVGAIYDMSKPGYIEFFWRDYDTDTIQTRNCNISALADFYNDVFNKPQKLKKFSFRD